MGNVNLIKETLEFSPLYVTLPEKERDELLARILFLDESREQRSIVLVH